MVGEAGERREGMGGEDGGVQADEGAHDDPREPKQELWDPGLHGAQAEVGSVRGGEGGPGFAFDNSTLPPSVENRSLAAGGDNEEGLVVPIMLMPREAPSIWPIEGPLMPEEAPSMPLMPKEAPAASMPCLMLCWELPSKGLLSLEIGSLKHVR